MRADLGDGVLVGGNSAAQLDFDDEVLGSLWQVLLLILVLTFVALAALLRSVVLPLKAIVTNLLSVAAAFGVLTIVYVWGWFDGLLGWDSPGYVDTFTVPLIIAAVFGLSMDYEVFLLSRIRERYEVSGDTRRAVGEALERRARARSPAQPRSWSPCSASSSAPACRRSSRSASAARSRSRSTRRSCGWCWCRRRWSCSDAGTGGGRAAMAPRRWRRPRSPALALTPAPAAAVSDGPTGIDAPSDAQAQGRRRR